MSDAISSGRSVLSAEAAALEAIARGLDGSFEAAVHLIADMSNEGRIIVSGMGKAGFIAMKLSATFASVGLSSFFLHPAEAVHGDLGRYTRKDVALILSNSGETQEILRMLPHLKRIGCPIIAISGQPESSLARHAEILLSIGQLDEADPLGLAPTTTTTAMLGLGDALAMAVLTRKGFTREQFAAFHPGGALGRLLTLVSEIMRQGDENCVVSDSMKTRAVIHQITVTRGRPGAAAVVNSAGELVGVFTDGNLRRLLDEGADFLDRPIREVMGASPRTVRPDQLAQEALRIMTDFRIDQVIVVDDQQKPIGLVDIQDVYRAA